MPSLVSSLLIMPAFFPCAWLEVLFVGVRKFQQVFQECPPLLQVPAPLFTSLSPFSSLYVTCFQALLPCWSSMINVCLLLEWKIESHYNDSWKGKKDFSNSPREAGAERLLLKLNWRKRHHQIRLPISKAVQAKRALLPLFPARRSTTFSLLLFGNDFDRKFFDKPKAVLAAEKALHSFGKAPFFQVP